MYKNIKDIRHVEYESRILIDYSTYLKFLSNSFKQSQTSNRAIARAFEDIFQDRDNTNGPIVIRNCIERPSEFGNNLQN